MLKKICMFVVTTLCLLAGESEAQLCVAESVVNMRIEANYRLVWFVRLGEPCEITEFFVSIFHPGQHAEYAFTLKETSLDVSFLEVCEDWTIVVVPVSGHALGKERRLTTRLPVHPDADISISSIYLEHNPYTNRAHLYWDLNDANMPNCSLQYRITIEESGSPVIHDLYVANTSINLQFLSSCKTYQFGVRAVNVAQPSIEGPLKSAVLTLPGREQYPPVLLDSEVGATWANLTFRLESEVRNPCQLRVLYVDGGAGVSQTIALTNDEERRPVNVTLTNLEPNTTYNLLVYVSNISGWSNATEVDIHTLTAERFEQEGKKM